MNLKLVFLLSLWGVAMALLTISIIPQNVEPVCWLIIFLINAILIARNCDHSYFLNGFLVSIANCVWITAAHIIWQDSYLSHHPQMQSMTGKLPPGFSITTMMLITGPIIGIISGLVQGLLAFIASKTPLRKKVDGAQAA